jgi:anti-anti-sigma factor
MEVREVSGGAEPGRLVLEVTGEVDLANCGGLESAVAAVFAAPRRPDALVLDLAEVSFLDSSGLRVVLSAAGLARTGGVDLSVIPLAGRLPGLRAGRHRPGHPEGGRGPGALRGVTRPG